MMKKIRIVIADDHQVLLDGLIMMLKNEGHIEVIGSASNGREALEILSSNEVDVLLMDIQMPIMDGIEASKIAAVRYPECKIIILSMHNEKAYIERLYETGISGYLLKSAGKEEIIDTIP